MRACTFPSSSAPPPPHTHHHSFNIWVRGCEFINGDNGLAISGAYTSSFLDIVFRTTKSRGRFGAGHHGIALSHGADNLVSG